jgi:thiamine-monophosphate kinase
MAKKKKATPLSELGEFGLIERLTKGIELKNKSSLKGVGDDAAVLDYRGEKMVLTTDLLVEGIHFNLIYTPLKHLGYKAITVNLSDVYAMNAIPGQVLVSVAVSGKFSLEAMEELYRGIRLACDTYGVDLVGGGHHHVGDGTDPEHCSGGQGGCRHDGLPEYGQVKRSDMRIGEPGGFLHGIADT